ncbi:hypothetical protein [Fimbriiglobus ruber]|uniref:Uncharacterized protein n=1 Tax=Fimbriiglobus ruber TaxID=1908690 RepID=A0A225DYN8_9BACT|nr:hypothetical protein [Fimbriiglobus ruber]OWK43648.1 hypothetical protein FRUB_03247 [Fimbriiglobus ruber]
MAKQASGDKTAPLVIALAFFVITTLALGIMYYMSFEQIAAEKNAAKEATASKTASSALLGVEQDKVLLYKIALGTATQEELEKLKSSAKEGEVRKEYQALMAEITGRLLGTPQTPGGLVAKEGKAMVGSSKQFALQPNDVVRWNWPEGAKLENGPERSILEAVVASYARQQLAANQLETEHNELEQSKRTFQDLAKRTQDAEAKLKETAAKFPVEVQAVKAAATTEVDATRKQFTAATNNYINDTKAMKTKEGILEVERDEIRGKIDALQKQLVKLDALIEAREDPFAYDRPHGKILFRKGNVITINLGSRDNVRPGLTFSVQPQDVPERGLQTRMRPRIVNGRPVFEGDKPSMEVVPKGTIEVTEVLGPEVSQARITSQTDAVREGIMIGDVLYNAVWHRGTSDHVALFGLFDIDSDGIDDIKVVIKDLSKMGVIVDAYYDLSTKKWVGKLTEHTDFAIEGAYPVYRGGSDSLQAAKNAIDDALHDAKKVARERGARVVKTRDFFPRVGYSVRLTTDPDLINRGYARYLQTPQAAGEGATADPADKKNN